MNNDSTNKNLGPKEMTSRDIRDLYAAIQADESQADEPVAQDVNESTEEIIHEAAPSKQYARQTTTLVVPDEDMVRHESEMNAVYYNASLNKEGEPYKNPTDVYRRTMGLSATGRTSKADEDFNAVHPLVMRTLAKRGVIFADNSSRVWNHLMSHKEEVMKGLAPFGLGFRIDPKQKVAYLDSLATSLSAARVDNLSDENFGLDAAHGRSSLTLAQTLVLIIIRQMEISQVSENNELLSFTLRKLGEVYESYEGGIGNDEQKFYKKLESICSKFCEMSLLRPVPLSGRMEVNKLLPSTMYQVTPFFPIFLTAKRVDEYTELLAAYVEQIPDALSPMARMQRKKAARGPKVVLPAEAGLFDEDESEQD